MIEIFGVIGYPLKHSLSPVMHNAAFRAINYNGIYLPFEVRREELKSAVAGAKALNIKGMNVTIPYKEEIARFFKPDRAVEEIGACNTVLIEKGECYNTDVYGIIQSLKNSGIGTSGMKVVVIGAGGAGKACIYALRDKNEVYLTNRTVKRGVRVARKFGVEFLRFEDLEKFSFDLVVNATPVGMKGFPSNIFFSLEVIKRANAVFDMVYNPPETFLLKKAKEFGCKTINGIEMLVYQGAKAFEMFTGREAPVDVMRKAVISELNKVT